MSRIGTLLGGETFLSTPSARRATVVRDHECRGKNISIHALREEGDIEDVVQLSIVDDFYPRPPRGGRLLRTAHLSDSIKFLSTPSARRATWRPEARPSILQISIHALREEGDPVFLTAAVRSSYFYPRPPRGGRHLAHANIDRAGIISIHALREEGDSKNRDKISIFL